MKRKQHRRKVRNRVVVATAASALLAFSAFWIGFHTKQHAQTTTAIATSPSNADNSDNAIVLTDKSCILPMDDMSVINVEKDTPSDVQVSIAEGGARFEVSPNANRNFVVQVKNVTVTVHGTIFQVERFASHVIVGVEEGLVQVDWFGGEKFLKPGQKERFPFFGGGVEDAPSESPADPLGNHEMSPEKQAKKALKDWRHYAHKGEFETASKIIGKKGDVRDTVDDLLLAADAMRLSGKPQEGIVYLTKIVTKHSRDPRAALAEFTRGRILLSQLGNPREAALSFRHVQKMASNSALAEDALAREVESWHRSGEQDTARERAELYTVRYPQGRRLKAVQKFGGLE
ncbi:MAG: FecR domain-containing protein [Deltaproteobacteria bacterium]|nr:FecR domain-containing protein [Deltaproteobacteria bacterium]MBN2672055.1 FecR domain-containing protein [Deltaproteobacteria bacterium]